MIYNYIKNLLRSKLSFFIDLYINKKNQKFLIWLLIRNHIFKNPVVIVKRKGNLGDIICTFPLIYNIRKEYPFSIIIYYCLNWNVEFPKMCRDVDIVVGLDTPFSKFVDKYFSKIMWFEPLFNEELSPPRPSRGLHIIDEMLAVSKCPFQNILTKKIKISNKSFLNIQKRISLDRILSNYIFVIHVGATWPVREWSVEKWNKLVSLLKSHFDSEIIQVGTDFVSSSGGRSTPRILNCFDWIGKISIEETAALLKIARLFIGIDSGIMHLAGAVNAPCVGIFGPTFSELRLPRNNKSVGVSSRVPCLGCQHMKDGPLHWQTGCPNDIQCMKELSVEEVFSTCLKLFESTNNSAKSSEKRVQLKCT